MGVTRGIDEAPVSAWLAAHVPGVVPPFSFALIAGGRSNLTFAVTDANGRCVVLRRPPLGHVLATAHDMAREHRIISAVGRPTCRSRRRSPSAPTPPSTARPSTSWATSTASCSTARRRPRCCPRPCAGTPAFDLIDVLAELHAVDVDAVGLGDLAKRDGLRRAAAEAVVDAVGATRRRASCRPSRRSRPAARPGSPCSRRSTIAHGDYRFGNCLVGPRRRPDGRRARLGAVHARRPAGRRRLPAASTGPIPAITPSRPNDPTGAGGFPSYDELLARYEARTGFDLSGID